MKNSFSKKELEEFYKQFKKTISIEIEINNGEIKQEDWVIEQYEEYRPDAFYTIGIDSSKGLKKDFSVCNVFRYNIDTSCYYQVCKFKNNLINPKESYPKLILEIIKLYNYDVFICLENNDIGYTVITILEKLLVKLNKEITFVNLGNSNNLELGIRNNLNIRNFMLMNFKSLIEILEKVKFRSFETINELDDIFEDKRGKIQALPGMNDDDFLSCCLALCVEHINYRELFLDECLRKKMYPTELNNDPDFLFSPNDFADICC